jgi:hypothetical protein
MKLNFPQDPLEMLRDYRAEFEIFDGFFENWGFSWADLIFNTMGSGFCFLQQAYPLILGGIQPRLSYSPSKAYGSESWIDDYEGLTYWLGVNIYHYLPHKIQKDYPAWLRPFGFALGYSAAGISNNPFGGKREIFIGLDFNLMQMQFNNDSGFIRFLKSKLNIIRLPLPAVKLTPNGVWYGIYF